MQRVREQVQVPEQIYSVTWRSEPVTVAVLDTGIAYHPDLAGHLLCFRDFVEKSSLPYDDNGHGTHVCGILAETENCRVEGFGEWHRHQNLSWEKCWMEREKDPVIPCRRLLSGSYG